MIKHYKQIPLELDAVQWDGSNFEEIKEFLGGGANLFNGCLFVLTGFSEVVANKSDYVTKSGTEDNKIVRVVEEKIFNKTYVEVI